MLELRRQTAIDPCPVKEDEQVDESNSLKEHNDILCGSGGGGGATSAANSALIHWPGMKYACLKVIQAYCKVFEQQDLYDLIVRYRYITVNEYD